MRGFGLHAIHNCSKTCVSVRLCAFSTVSARSPASALAGSHSALAGPTGPRPNRPGCYESLVASARNRKSRQGNDTELEQSREEPQIDFNKRSEVISTQLQLRLDHVRPLVRQNPALAYIPLDKLCRRLPLLAHALSVPLRQALFMVGRHPAVLDVDPQQLIQQCSSLAAAVELPDEQVMFMAARQPYLLEVPPGRTAAEAQKLAAALGCSTRGALQLLSRLSGNDLRVVLNMSSSTVLQRLPEVIEALGLPSDSTRRLDMLHLVAKHPGLLAVSLNDIGRSTDALLVAFQQSAPLTFAAVLGKCPSLLTFPPERLLANYQGLLLQLQVPRATLARMLAKHPQLLRSSPDNVAHKLRAMAYHMYLPQGQVISMCIRQPALLSRDSETLQACLVSLQTLLQANYQTAVTAAARAPNLLLWKPSNLCAKHELLQQASGLLPARLNLLLLQNPGILTLSHTQIITTLSCLQEQLQLSVADLGQILLKDPKILIRGGRVLQEQVQDLQEYLALPAAVIAQLVRRCPGILAAGSAVWLANIKLLLEVLQLNPQQVQSAVLVQPSLLQKQPGELVEVVGQLTRLVRQHQPWRDELNHLGQQELEVVLRLRHKNLPRLAYLLGTGQQCSLFRDARLALNNALWAGKHEPQYSSWLKRQRQPAASHGAAVQPDPAAVDAAEECRGASQRKWQRRWQKQRPRQLRRQQTSEMNGQQSSRQGELQTQDTKAEPPCSMQQPHGPFRSTEEYLEQPAGQLRQQQQGLANPQQFYHSQERFQHWSPAVEEQQQLHAANTVMKDSSCIAVSVPVG